MTIPAIEAEATHTSVASKLKFRTAAEKCGQRQERGYRAARSGIARRHFLIEDKVFRELAEKIVVLNRELMSRAEGTGEVNPEVVTLVADLRGYFVYRALECSNEDSLELSVLLETLSTLALYDRDSFDAGFFTALAKAVTSRFEEQAARSAWNTRFDASLKRLDIESTKP